MNLVLKSSFARLRDVKISFERKDLLVVQTRFEIWNK